MDQLQELFFKRIRQNMPGHLSFADEVANLLNISNDSAYRRIRNEKSISFEEIKILSAHFNVSVDEIMNLESDTGSYFAKYITPESFDFTRYMEVSYRELETIAQCKDSEMFYYCKDFPLFYYYAFPELAAFKYFIWMKTSLNFPALANVPFSFDYYMKPFIDIGEKILRMYLRINGTEIMNIENVITTLHQIEYYKRSFMFGSNDVVNTLLDKLDEMICHIWKQADEGVKFFPSGTPNSQSPKYNLYVNDFMIGDNSIIGCCNNSLVAYITHSHINYLKITDAKFTAYHFRFIKNIMKKSILISDTGEKYRARFFCLIRKKIEECRNNKLDTMG